jgi:uncharacterized protein YcgL (UPF0745 family)
MLCFIYKSLKRDELYLFLEKKDDFSAVPEELIKSLGRLQFVMELQLSPERKLAREDAKKVIAGIESKGFYIQMPPITLPDSSSASNRVLH